MTFFEYYGTLTNVEEKKKLRNAILEKTGVSYPTFYAWLRRRKISVLAQKEIANILNMPKCELFPIEKNQYSLVINQ